MSAKSKMYTYGLPDTNGNNFYRKGHGPGSYANCRCQPAGPYNVAHQRAYLKRIKKQQQSDP